MNEPYARILPRAFKRFSVLSARRTLLPTIGYYVRRPALPAGEKPALFTMNILPPMMTVWHHLVRKHLGDRVDVVIFDSSGNLDPTEFPGARVQKFLNMYAATKSEEFLRKIARNRRIGWLCDDDMFPLSATMVDIMEREFQDPNTATVSFRPRPWWHFEIDGKSYEPSSSYCIALNRDIVVEKENLSLGPCNGNTHPSHIGKAPGRYDTCDKMNEELLKKGYRCFIVPEEERKDLWAGFSGVSGAVALLNYFTTPEQVLAYYEEPPAVQWSGNMLFGTLSAMIAVSIVQDLYTALKGKPYPLPSLPPRNELDRILQKRKEYFREDQRIEDVIETGERLKAAL